MWHKSSGIRATFCLSRFLWSDGRTGKKSSPFWAASLTVRMKRKNNKTETDTNCGSKATGKLFLHGERAIGPRSWTMSKFLLTLDGKEGSIYSSLARNKSGVIPKWLRRGESEEGGRVYPSRTRRAANDTVKGQTWEPRTAWNNVWTILNGWKFSTQPYFTCNILMNTSSLTLRKSRLRRIKHWVFEPSRMRPLESTPIYRNATFEQSLSSPRMLHFRSSLVPFYGMNAVCHGISFSHPFIE